MSIDKILDLGVMTDSDLSYASHISSIVHSILEYASQVWNPSILKNSTYLENVHRNFTYLL